MDMETRKSFEELYFAILRIANELGFTFEEMMEVIVEGHKRWLEEQNNPMGVMLKHVEDVQTTKAQIAFEEVKKDLL